MYVCMYVCMYRRKKNDETAVNSLLVHHYSVVYIFLSFEVTELLD